MNNGQDSNSTDGNRSKPNDSTAEDNPSSQRKIEGWQLDLFGKEETPVYFGRVKGQASITSRKS